MPQRHFFELGVFRLDPAARVLFCRDEVVPLAPKALDTLLFLVERRGNVVDKETLLKEIWPDTFVEEGSLTRNVYVLRKVFADESSATEWIETIPKRGYRFVGPVEELGEAEAAATLPAPDSAESKFATPGPKKSQFLRPGQRTFAALLATAVIVVAGYMAYRQMWPHKSGASGRIMLAVLPVQNLTGDPSRDYLTDGLTEELIAQLGGLNPAQLGVIARTSSMSYRGTSKTISEIGRELEVDYIVETNLRGTPQRLRFTAQLIRTRDQSHVWAQDFDRDPQDLVALEDDVGRAIAGKVEVQLSPAASARMERALNVSSDSYRSYLLGRQDWNRRTQEGLASGLEHFTEATRQDPGNARAFTGIADSYNMLLYYGYTNDMASIVRAKTAAERALRLDDSLAEAHASLGYVYFMWTWQWPEAEREFRRAIDLDQNYAPAHHWFALYLAAMGRGHEADEQIRFAETLDPQSPIMKTAAGYIHYFARDYNAAIQECQRVLDHNPNFVVAHAVLGLAYEGKGRYNDAIAEFEKTVALTDRNFVYEAYLAHALAASGNRLKAENIMTDLRDRAGRGIFIGQYSLAVILVGLGEKEKAIAALNRAREQDDASCIWLRVDPRMDSLRTDPRWQQLLHDQTRLTRSLPFSVSKQTAKVLG
jgi:TolB-like protein/DNA-binding winged helix-turn-helix (wHTH) protein/Flp pilus assembly protein TadD